KHEHIALAAGTRDTCELLGAPLVAAVGIAEREQLADLPIPINGHGAEIDVPGMARRMRRDVFEQRTIRCPRRLRVRQRADERQIHDDVAITEELWRLRRIGWLTVTARNAAIAQIRGAEPVAADGHELDIRLTREQQAQLRADLTVGAEYGN